jgi:pimeloyl-ACP methyl ester carboxylesterase
MLPDPLAVNERIQNDSELRDLSGNADIVFQLHSRLGTTWTVTVRDGDTTIAEAQDGDETAFRIELNASDWSALLASSPSPGQQHVAAFVSPRGTGTVSGSEESYAQHLHLVRRVLEIAAARPDSAPPAARSLDHVVGRYARTHVESWGDCDIYYESAGNGLPVILLATAGSDNRQYHGLMSDPQLTSKYRLIAPDLPWHGKSMPAAGRRGSEYSLTTRTYTDCIANFIQALRLAEKPVLVGASMAGAVVVEMAALHPGLLHGVVGSQAGPRVSNRLSKWLRNPRVNQTLHVPEWTYGLMSPDSPKTDRDRVWWGYSQGGYGVYERDIEYYSTSWDIDNIAHLFDESTPPVVLMNGIYDYSVPPEATRELASRIPYAAYREMPELGHFPHAENPEVFSQHLRWALDAIQQQHKTSKTQQA